MGREKERERVTYLARVVCSPPLHKFVSGDFYKVFFDGCFWNLPIELGQRDFSVWCVLCITCNVFMCGEGVVCG